jgi:hypothetical protein
MRNSSGPHAASGARCYDHRHPETSGELGSFGIEVPPAEVAECDALEHAGDAIAGRIWDDTATTPGFPTPHSTTVGPE